MFNHTLYMMVGLSGSGKSTASKIIFQRKFNAGQHVTIASSDKIREELYGNESIQGDNNQIFNLLHESIRKSLLYQDVIYDATNLNQKKRVKFLNTLPKSVEKIAVIMATPYEECLRRNANRDRVVPASVIKRQYMNFQIPLESEGFDDVLVYYGENFDKINFAENYTKAIKKCVDFNQDNPHHELTLDEHMLQACYHYNGAVPEVASAISIHDIGKPFTRTFVNTKGETTETAHYYGHDCVGGYEAMFVLNAMTRTGLYVAQLVNYHMQPFFHKGEKALAKLEKKLGSKMFKDIMAIHEADKKAKKAHIDADNE